jgi:hypothetical protein
VAVQVGEGANETVMAKLVRRYLNRREQG